MTPQEFIQQWGAELVTVSPTSVEGLWLPAPDKEFLTLAGLPRQAPIPSAYDFASLPVELPVPRQEADPKHRLLERYGASPFLRLGYIKGKLYNPFYDSMPFCVEERTGRVGIMSPDQNFDFINSSVSQFALALLEYRAFSEFADQNEESHPRKVHRRLRELERALKASDPEAFSSGEYYWSVYLDELDFELP